ncbi:MAG: hypothetical protein K2P58_07215 [Hyphomonadaceae bacterium]|nr:hypothetical protein [Hyphomonadaceae bacterium]
MTDIWGPEYAGAMWVATFAIALGAFVFWVFLQWRVFSKAGFPGALALINLAVFVPVVGIVIVLALQAWFAFAQWPALRKPQA